MAGVSAEDERFSWRAALAAMLALSAVASLGFVFSVNPFAISFNIAFVYLPTVILIVGPYVTTSKRKTGGYASSQAG